MTMQVRQVESHAVPSQRERDDLPQKVARELVWYANAPRFHDEADIVAARKAHGLIPIKENPNIRPVRGFNRGDITGTYALLTPRALNAALLLGRLWRDELRRVGIDDPRLRLPLTSMTRTQVYQNKIVAEGRLAIEESTHQTGNTFDIDLSAYTLLTPVGGVPIVTPERHKQHNRRWEFAAYRQMWGAYDERVSQALLPVLDGLHQCGIVNRIYEFSNTPNSTVHVAVSPDFVK